jgi:hypothetical protein
MISIRARVIMTQIDKDTVSKKEAIFSQLHDAFSLVHQESGTGTQGRSIGPYGEPD